jgi:hypothetical protein
VIPAIIAGGYNADAPVQGLRTVGLLQERFVAAAAPYAKQIRHPEPQTALVVVFRNAVSYGAHRAASLQMWPDGLTWEQWSAEIADMSMAYLKAKR